MNMRMVVLLWTLALISMAFANECPLGEVYDDIYETSQSENLRICTEHQTNSCCSAEYAESIIALEDPLSVQLNANIYPDENTLCEDLLQDLSCIACSPSQSAWLDVHTYGITINVCGSYCEELFEACANVTFHLESQYQPVSALFDSADDFCHALTPTDDVSLVYHGVESDACWDNTVECTEEDYYQIYTECDRYHNNRSLIWEIKPASRCKGGYQPPPARTGLPCAITCEEGYYLPATSPECQPCSPGSFSLGGGERVEIWESWDRIDLPFRTYCTEKNDALYVGDTPCGWELDGEQIISGAALNDSMSSILEVPLILVRDGHVRFSFQVDAEVRYDGLMVTVNDVQKFGPVFVQNDFTEITLPLDIGYHLVRWIFFKDGSYSQGLDMATIEMIEVDGIGFADRDCDVCPIGSYASEEASNRCYDCPPDTYAPKTGFHECLDCPDNSYSYEGSAQCISREPCTLDDMEYLYGQCVKDSTGTISRKKNWYYLEPTICNQEDGIPKPNPTDEECAPCNAGEYRPDGEADCLFCPEGQYSDVGATECQACSPGHDTKLSVSFQSFDEFDNGLTTNCTYDCGTDGWRLLESAIDSGSGHGHFAASSLYLTTDIIEIGATVEFTFSLECAQPCELTFSDNNGFAQRYYGNSFNNITNATQKFPLALGEQTLEWTFVKNDPHEISRSDRAIITSITATGTSIGGAASCDPCPPGSYSPDGNQCLLTPPGYYSFNGSSSYTQCPVGTFNPLEGQGECTPCGLNTKAAADRLSCTYDCTLSIPGTDIVYDLSPLKRTDSMYGPVFDSHDQEYYINVCSTQHRNHTCFDGDGNAIQTFSCQTTEHQYSEDTGNVIGFSALDDDPRGGLNVHYTNGHRCPEQYDFVHRTTDVKFICDAEAGVGELFGVDDIESPPCHYNLEFRSVYACPLCTAEDYHYYVTECQVNEEEAFRTRVYEWVDNPKRCHHGVSLPPTESISCNNWGKPCPPGQYLDTSGEEESCKDAPPGTYSIGGGVEYNEWLSWPEGFKVGGWLLNGDAIRSGDGDSFFFISQNFFVNGSVSFEYKVYSTLDDEDSGLQFLVDEVPATPLIQNTDFNYRTWTVDVSEGPHVLKWVFQKGSEGSENMREKGARIRRIIVLNEQAALSPTPCRPGTYTNVPAQTQCEPCPKNTKGPTAGMSQCEPCEDDMYSLTGSVTCSLTPRCTVDDYQEVYSECDERGTMRSYVALEPKICSGGYSPEELHQDPPIPCFPCRAGFYRDSSYQCTRCESGQYYDEDQEVCVDAQPGAFALPIIGFFDQPESEWPQGFETICSGQCGPSAWRVRGNQVDSGFHNGEVDSVLNLSVTLLIDGELSFQYRIESLEAPSILMNGLEFFVDSRQIDIPYHPTPTVKRGEADPDDTTIVVPLHSGVHTLTWNYHQEHSAIGNAVLHNIRVSGVSNGGALGQTYCEPGTKSSNPKSLFCNTCEKGTFSNGEGNTECTICEANHIAEFMGSESCTECGMGTFANEDATTCYTECTISADGRSYDLAPLSNLPGPYPLSERGSRLYLDVCNKTTNGGCTDANGNPLDTHVCESYDGSDSTDMGRLLSMSTAKRAGDTVIMMKYTGGDRAGCTGVQQLERTTELLLFCDMSAPSDSGPIVSKDSNANNICFITLEWRTPFACPLCTDDDYELQETDCENSKRKTANVRINDQCFGPLVKGEITEESCTKSVAVPFLIILGVGVLLLVLFICIIVVCIQHRRVQNRYSLLVSESSKQYEMETLDNESAQQA